MNSIVENKVELSTDMVFLMTFIHTKQLREWLSLIIGVKNPKLLFKFNVNNAYKAIINLDNYLNSNKKTNDDWEEEYEMSAEISDAIMEIAKFNEDDKNQVYELISKLKNKQ